MSKKPFIGKNLRPTITKDTKLANLTVGELAQFFAGTSLGKAQPEKVRFFVENVKEIIPDIIKHWKEVALEADFNIRTNEPVINVLDDIRNELAAIREKLNKPR